MQYKTHKNKRENIKERNVDGKQSDSYHESK